MSREADAIVCLEVPAEFYAVGEFFEDFSQVSDEEVAAILQKERTGNFCCELAQYFIGPILRCLLFISEKRRKVLSQSCKRFSRRYRVKPIS